MSEPTTEQLREALARTVRAVEKYDPAAAMELRSIPPERVSNTRDAKAALKLHAADVGFATIPGGNPARLGDRLPTVRLFRFPEQVVPTGPGSRVITLDRVLQRQLDAVQLEDEYGPEAAQQAAPALYRDAFAPLVDL